MVRIILAVLALIFGIYGAYLLVSAFVGMNPIEADGFTLNPTIAYLQLTTMILGLGAVTIAAILAVAFLIEERG